MKFCQVAIYFVVFRDWDFIEHNFRRKNTMISFWSFGQTWTRLQMVIHCEGKKTTKSQLPLQSVLLGRMKHDFIKLKLNRTGDSAKKLIVPLEMLFIIGSQTDVQNLPKNQNFAPPTWNRKIIYSWICFIYWIHKWGDWSQILPILYTGIVLVIRTCTLSVVGGFVGSWMFNSPFFINHSFLLHKFLQILLPLSDHKINMTCQESGPFSNWGQNLVRIENFAHMKNFTRKDHATNRHPSMPMEIKETDQPVSTDAKCASPTFLVNLRNNCLFGSGIVMAPPCCLFHLHQNPSGDTCKEDRFLGQRGSIWWKHNNTVPYSCHSMDDFWLEMIVSVGVVVNLSATCQ